MKEKIRRFLEYVPVFGEPKGPKAFAAGLDQKEAEDISEELKLYRKGFDDDRTKMLYGFLESRGYTVEEVDQNRLYGLFGPQNDPVAGRIGDNIYIGLNHGKRKLTDAEKRSAAYHEMAHDHTDSEIGAHLRGMEIADAFSDSQAAEEMRKHLVNLRKHNYN